MSKAFTKESDHAVDELLPVVDESLLPAGEKNYITLAGLDTLRGAIDALREAVGGNRLANEQRLLQLSRQLERAAVVDPATQPHDRVLFGAVVTVRDEAEVERRYRIVGVFEADAKQNLISWRSPMARALTNHRVGDLVTVQTPAGATELEVVAIAYPNR
jgi:transcription elongation factor GreB